MKIDDILEDLPADWISHSDKDAARLAGDIQRRLIEENCNTEIIEITYPGDCDLFLHPFLPDFSVGFYKKPYGCDIEVRVYEPLLNTYALLHTWQKLVDEGIVWGGDIRKTPEKESPPQEAAPFPKPWEFIEKIAAEKIAAEKIGAEIAAALVFLFLTCTETVRDLQSKLCLRDELSQRMSRLRDRYPDAKIPGNEGEEETRSSYRRKWELYLMKHPDEQEKYKKKTEASFKLINPKYEPYQIINKDGKPKLNL